MLKPYYGLSIWHHQCCSRYCHSTSLERLPCRWLAGNPHPCLDSMFDTVLIDDRSMASSTSPCLVRTSPLISAWWQAALPFAGDSNGASTPAPSIIGSAQDTPCHGANRPSSRYDLLGVAHSQWPTDMVSCAVSLLPKAGSRSGDTCNNTSRPTGPGHWQSC